MIQRREGNGTLREYKRFLYLIVVRPLLKMYWFLVRPKTRGTRIILEHGGEVLFVQLGYAGKFWTFPGGGVERGESFKESALREAQEEVGISVSDAELFLEYANRRDYKWDTVQCFSTTVLNKDVVIDGFEIINAIWATPEEGLPVLSPGAQRILSKYNEYKRGLLETTP